MDGFDGLILSEKDALGELKKRFDREKMNLELKNDNNMYLRFLRARDYNIDLAEDMLRKHIAWRKANQIDEILTNYVQNEICAEYIPIVRFGYDKDGDPVRYYAFGAADHIGVVKSSRSNDIIKNFVYFFEDDTRAMKDQSLKLGRPIEQWSCIMDFDGYTFAKAAHKKTIETLLQLFQTYEGNYPERLKKVFVINASIYFTMLYSVVKPVLSGTTVRKVFIYRKNGWKNDLLKQIDPDVLPAFLGGEKTDPDGNPLCNTIVKHGKTVPEELFLSKSSNRLSSQPDAKKVTVSRKSETLLPVKVSEIGSMLEWEFETESRDIGFGLKYRESDKESAVSEDLIPIQRIDANLLKEAGAYICHKPGTYILVFDNTYSWIYSKEIYCKVSVVAPSVQARH